MTLRDSGRSPAAVAHDVARDSVRLRQFLGWFAAIVFIFGAIFTALAAHLHSRRLGVAGVLLAAFFFVLAHAYSIARRGFIERAAVYLGYALFVVLVGVSFALPWGAPAYLIVCLILICAELPYLKGAKLAQMLALCFISIGVTAVNGYRAIGMPHPSAEVLLVLNVGGATAAALLVLLLLWQFSERLHETLAEQRASAGRSRFLAQVSDLLLKSLDSPALTSRFAELVVNNISDWFTVSLRMPDGQMQRVACVHRDLSKKALADAYGALPGRIESSMPEIDQVLLTQGPVYLRDITDQWMHRFSRSAEELRILQGMGARSAIIAPLKVGDSVFGVISYICSDDPEGFSEADIELASELAARLALALHNARLLESERAAVQVREDFLSIAGHELKTPLTAGLLQVQSLDRLLRRSDTQPPPELLQQRVTRLREQVERLARLTDELLDISRISAGRLHLEEEECDLASLARDVVERFAGAAAKARSEIHLGGCGPVVGVWDRLRVEQVLTNLLGNALKFGAGKPIRIDTKLEQRMAILCVQDDGIGISEENHRRIFERYERGVSEREFKGLGLGLWITKQIVDALGGEISVESRVGAGARFVVKLPQGGHQSRSHHVVH